MAYGSKNPRLTSAALTDQVAASVADAPTGTVRIINRNGELYRQDSAGVETKLLAGASAYLTAAKVADYAVTDTDNVSLVLMTTAGTNRTVTLPTAADNTHRVITVKKVDSGTGQTIIDGEGAETIDGAANVKLYKQYESVTLVCDGTAWHLSTASWAQGQYTPTVVSDVNISASTPQICNFTRNNLMVFVTGTITGITTDASGTDSSVTIDLPIATANFSAVYQASGVATLWDNAMVDEAMYVTATSGAQTVLIHVDTTAQAASAGKAIYFSFSYQIQ